MTAFDTYHGLEPTEVWRHFAALNDIPRQSGNEAAACAYVEQVAAGAGADVLRDARSNVIVRVAATEPTLAYAPIVAIQSHLDMVCEKRPEVVHDFATDPIRPRREGDLVYATGTTLGADNGMGAAMMLALLTAPGHRHGPLELLFTVEEETGLYGAMALEPEHIDARWMINLDSEDPDEITVGCAGGAGTMLFLPIKSMENPTAGDAYAITVSGLKGGHSGVQIHEPLANAIKLLTSTLIALRDADIEFSLAGIEGGTAHNAIARDAVAVLVVASQDVESMQNHINVIQDDFRLQWGEFEPSLALQATPADTPPQVLRQTERDLLLELLHDLPHGVLKMSDAFAGKVETSSNLAGVRAVGADIEIATSSRSFNPGALQAVQDKIGELGRTAGALIEVRDGYPGWEPNPDSQLLKLTEAAYRALNGHDAKVEVIHAGLECGVIVSKVPGMEAVSFGPLIRGAHSPEEHIDSSTVAPIWKLLLNLLERAGDIRQK